MWLVTNLNCTVYLVTILSIEYATEIMQFCEVTDAFANELASEYLRGNLFKTVYSKVEKRELTSLKLFLPLI